MTPRRVLEIQSMGGSETSVTKLLFIHGYGGDRQAWVGNAPVLFENAQCLVVDLPGHGGSVHVQGWSDLQGVADLLLANSQFEQPIHLVGHSAGAAVALLCAAKRPDTVKSITLVAPFGLGQGVSPAFTESLAALDNTPDAFSLLQSLVHNKRLIVDAFADMLLEHLGQPGARQSLRDFAAAMHGSVHDLQSAIKTISTEAIQRQVFWGRQDVINPLNEQDVSTFGGDWYCLDNCGHLPHVEHRVLFNNKLLEFVKS